MHKRLFLALFATGFPFLVGSFAAEEKDETDKRDLQAREISEQFMKGIGSQDIEAVMKTVDVPFFLEGENFKDRQVLKKKMEGMLAPQQFEYKVRASYPFGSLPEKFFSDTTYKRLKEVLEKTDRIVLLQIPQRFIVLAVRAQEGKAKVIGLHFARPRTVFVVAQEKDKGDKRALKAREDAKETVEQFLKTAKTKDLDSLMKLADVPWNDDGEKIIKDRDELKQVFRPQKQRFWGDFVGQAQLLAVTRLGSLGDPISKSSRLPFEKVITKDDWVALLGGAGRGYLLLVRVREGDATKCKIVGIAGGWKEKQD